MIYDEISDAIVSYLKTNFTEVDSQVFKMNSIASFPAKGSYGFPFVGVIYAGSTPDSLLSHEAIVTHRFDIRIYTSVYSEESTLGGDGTYEGLYDLNQILYGLIKDERYCVALDSKVISAIPIEIYGTESFIDVAPEGYGGTIGVRMEYKEQEL